MCRLLLADRSPVVRTGLRAMLSGVEPFVVALEAGTARQVREYAPQADMVIMGLSFPDVSGLQLIRELVAAEKSATILVFSIYDECIFAPRIYRNGAQGFVSKFADRDTVIDAVRKVSGGGIAFSDSFIERMFARGRGLREKATAIEALSDRELEVFQLVGDGLTTNEIASRFELSAKTIETYRENLKEKLGFHNANQLLRAAVLWSLDHADTIYRERVGPQAAGDSSA